MTVLQSGLSLSLRNVSSMVVILTATSMVTGLGAVTMAAHEILRQVWIISIQSFMALDICAQSLVASYLGQVTNPVQEYSCFLWSKHLTICIPEACRQLCCTHSAVTHVHHVKHQILLLYSAFSRCAQVHHLIWSRKVALQSAVKSCLPVAMDTTASQTCDCYIEDIAGGIYLHGAQHFFAYSHE